MILNAQTHPTAWNHLHEVAILIGREKIREEAARGRSAAMVEVWIPYGCWLTWHAMHLHRGATPYVSAGHHLSEVQTALREVTEHEIATPPLVRFHESP